jgi:hypothetical protein
MPVVGWAAHVAHDSHPSPSSHALVPWPVAFRAQVWHQATKRILTPVYPGANAERRQA